MARQLRIDYAGAFYHIFSRGNEKKAIFYSDEDRYYFLKALGEANTKFGVVFYAYCLMPNHYHLIGRTLRGGLSRAMHLINTSYTLYLNKKHARCGHLFQGRFRSILVEEESYATALSRYIHLNPVRAGLALRPEDYHWSSYREYLGIRRCYPWLDTSLTLGHDDNLTQERRAAYADYVLAGIGMNPPEGYSESKRTGIMGGQAFIDRIENEYLKGRIPKPDRELPQARIFKPRRSLSELLALAEKTLGPQNRFVRSTAIFLSHRGAEYTLEEIGGFFGMSISGVSNARRKIQREIEQNSTLAQAVHDIMDQLKG
jgi:REP element-mobilizing transposase RayT